MNKNYEKENKQWCEEFCGSLGLNAKWIYDTHVAVKKIDMRAWCLKLDAEVDMARRVSIGAEFLVNLHHPKS